MESISPQMPEPRAALPKTLFAAARDSLQEESPQKVLNLHPPAHQTPLTHRAACYQQSHTISLTRLEFFSIFLTPSQPTHLTRAGRAAELPQSLLFHHPGTKTRSKALLLPPGTVLEQEQLRRGWLDTRGCCWRINPSMLLKLTLCTWKPSRLGSEQSLTFPYRY